MDVNLTVYFKLANFCAKNKNKAYNYCLSNKDKAI